jgi:Flp pilus assembly protein TadD
VLYYRLKQFPEATEHLGRAIALNPKQPESHIVQGLAYLQQEQYDKSAEVFLQGIRHNPKNADLHFNLGTAYDKLNRFDDVVQEMETAIKLDPHHADALNYLGYSYAERGIRIDQAVSLTKQAVALKPENGYYVDSLGWAFFKSGQVSEALVELKRAAALVGDDPVIYEHLGDIYATQQRLSDAREAWLHALELDPTNLKLMDRFREQGMGDPAQEERIQQAKRRVAGQKPSLRSRNSRQRTSHLLAITCNPARLQPFDGSLNSMLVRSPYLIVLFCIKTGWAGNEGLQRVASRRNGNALGHLT